jgi:capsular polysaccharide biosynthesis protein
VELGTIWRTLARHRIVSGLTLVVFVLAACYFAYSPADRYESTATLLVEPRDPSAPATVSTVTFLIPALQVRVGTTALAEDAQQLIPPGLRDAGVGIGTSNDPGTGILRITATGTDGIAVAPWANAYGRALEAAQDVADPIKISVIDPAREPGGPSGPARTSTLVSGVVLALLAMVAAAFGAEALARRRRPAEEIRRRLDLPVLGEIPRIPRARRADVATHVLAGMDPAIVDAIMRTRTRVESRMESWGLDAVTVTSLDRSDGSSLVTSALAWALTWAGRPTAVIDADTRFGALAQLVVPEDARSSRRSFGDVVEPTSGGPSLTVVRATRLAEVAERDVGAARGRLHAAEILAIALPSVVADLQDQHRWVLVDAPALGVGAEAAVAAQVTGGVVVVTNTRHGRAVERVRAAVTAAEATGAAVVGVVLTGTSRRPHRPVRPAAAKTPASRPATAPLVQSDSLAPETG